MLLFLNNCNQIVAFLNIFVIRLYYFQTTCTNFCSPVLSKGRQITPNKLKITQRSPSSIFFFHNRMTDEERHEMEKQVRSLQESYTLLSNEALKQLQEAHLGDEKMEEKVTRLKLRFQSLLRCTAWFSNHT